MRKSTKLLISILICQMAGAVGSLFTKTSVETWYPALEKPFFTPPSWMFAPVWIALYMMMGISAYLVWEKGLDEKRIRNALCVFLFQLIINVSWSIAFFGMRSIAGGLFVIIILWVAILWTIIRFAEISKWASLLLLPYILWVSFALLLNTSFLFLNG